MFIVGLTFLSSSSFSQPVSRVKVRGVLFSKYNDVESITIYNTSSNKGTITNMRGEFDLEVGVHDILEISALQFQALTIIIDQETLISKQLNIQLVEQVNQLDAVTLSSGLTGNIATDIYNVKIVKPLSIDMGYINLAYEYNDDNALNNSLIEKDLKKITNSGEFYGGLNFGEIFKLLQINKIKKQKGKSASKFKGETFYSEHNIEGHYNFLRKSKAAVIALFFESSELNQKEQEAFLWYCAKLLDLSPGYIYHTDLEMLAYFNAKLPGFKDKLNEN